MCTCQHYAWANMLNCLTKLRTDTRRLCWHDKESECCTGFCVLVLGLQWCGVYISEIWHFTRHFTHATNPDPRKQCFKTSASNRRYLTRVPTIYILLIPSDIWWVDNVCKLFAGCKSVRCSSSYITQHANSLDIYIEMVKFNCNPSWGTCRGRGCSK